MFTLLYVCTGAFETWTKPCLLNDVYDTEAGVLRGVDRQAEHDCCTVLDVVEGKLTGRELRRLAKPLGATLPGC